MTDTIANHRLETLQNTDSAFVAIVLNEGFDDPPLRLDHGLRWYHLAVLAACAFTLGPIVYEMGWGG